MSDAGFLQQLFDAVVGVFVSGEKRTWWPLLASAASTAALVTWVRTPRGERASAFRRAFSRAYWWHPSARVDYQLWLFNTALRVALLSSAAVGYAWVAAAWSASLKTAFGPVAAAPWGAGVAAVVFTVVAFVADDATRFALHAWMHRSPVLWRIHRVHHTAEVLTPMTLYRIHPIESALYSVRLALTHGTVTGIAYYVLGGTLSAVDLVGVNALTLAFSALAANLRHSHVWLSWGTAVERYFLSPAQHQLHHSAAEEHVDRNLGTFLAVWDRWRGTWIEAGERPGGLRFGVSDVAAEPHAGLVPALVSPVVSAIRATRSRGV